MAMKVGINSEGMQRANRNLVIKILLEEKSLSRIELSRRTNLNRATITNIINDFLESGVVTEESESTGRKGSLLSLCCEKCVVLSARLTRSFLEICAFTILGEITRRNRIAINKDDDISITLKLIREQIDGMIASVGEKNVLGMCVGVSGPYVRGQRNVAIVSEFKQLSRIDFQVEMSNGHSFFVVTEHDTQLSTLAEWKQLDLPTREKERCMIGIQSLDIGIGAGIIIDGKMFNGAAGFAGEVGHMGINFNGNADNRRYRGILESYASTGAACGFVAQRLYEYPDTCLLENSPYGEIKAAYFRNDPLAMAAMDELAWKLAYGLSGIVYILNPDRIVISEDYPKDERFLQKLRSSMSGMLSPEVLETTTIQYSDISIDATLLGGYYHVLDVMLKKDLLLTRMKQCGRGVA